MFSLFYTQQFTLQCVLKGNKPDFHEAMAAEDSKKFYLEFLDHLRRAHRPDAIKGKPRSGTIGKSDRKREGGE